MLVTVEALGSFSSHTLCNLDILWAGFVSPACTLFSLFLFYQLKNIVEFLHLIFFPVLAKCPWTTHKCLKMPRHISDQAIQKVSCQPSGTSNHRHVYQTWHIIFSLYPYYPPISAGGRRYRGRVNIANKSHITEYFYWHLETFYCFLATKTNDFYRKLDIFHPWAWRLIRYFKVNPDAFPQKYFLCVNINRAYALQRCNERRNS